MWLRILTHIVIVLFVVMAAFQYAACAFAEEDVIKFTGQMVLPHDLYTPTGTRLEKGKCKLQIRSENGGYWLSFWRGDQRTVELEGEVREDNSKTPLGVPMFGTSRMVPDKSLGRAGGGGSRTGDRWFRQSRPWQAAMRTYKSVGPNDREVLFVFQANVAVDRWCRVEFKIHTSAQNPQRK